MNTLLYSFIFVFSLKTFFCKGQCTDTLYPIRFPCCVSGVEWSEEDQTLYVISDLQNKVYKAKLSVASSTVTVFDSILLLDSPHNIGLEAIRKEGSSFYLTYEKDEIVNGERKAKAFVAKGTYDGQHSISIEKTLEMPDLPSNKGVESLAFSDKKTLWMSHESMARPKNGLDSVKFIALDTLLHPLDFKWYALHHIAYFEGNEAAYNDYGVSEFLVRNDSFYVIERGWGRKDGIGEVFITIFKVPVASLKKSLPLYTFRSSTTPMSCLDNFEALCYIPSLGKLLMISDDNNQKKIQKTLIRLLSP